MSYFALLSLQLLNCLGSFLSWELFLPCSWTPWFGFEVLPALNGSMDQMTSRSWFWPDYSDPFNPDPPAFIGTLHLKCSIFSDCVRALSVYLLSISHHFSISSYNRPLCNHWLYYPQQAQPCSECLLPPKGLGKSVSAYIYMLKLFSRTELSRNELLNHVSATC